MSLKRLHKWLGPDVKAQCLSPHLLGQGHHGGDHHHGLQVGGRLPPASAVQSHHGLEAGRGLHLQMTNLLNRLTTVLEAALEASSTWSRVGAANLPGGHGGHLLRDPLSAHQ